MTQRPTIFYYSLAVVCALAVAMHGARADEAKEPYKPKVVRTWGELRKQPPLKLADGTTMRIGLETTEVPRHGAFLVYGMLDGTKWQREGLNPLGALHLSLHRPGDPRVRVFVCGMRHVLVRRWEEATRLCFVATMMVGEAGDYHLEFNGPKEKTVALAPITVKRDVHHPWMRFEETERDSVRLDGTFKAHLAYSPKLTLRNYDGGYPVAADVGNESDVPAESPLPGTYQSVGTTPDPRLKLSFNGKTLVLESEDKLYLDRPAKVLLCRWWVNGKPAAPRLAKKGKEAEGKDAYEKAYPGRWLHVDVDLDRLRLKPGDRVGVQLLYVPKGWRIPLTGLRVAQVRTRIKPKTDRYLPRLTNRVEHVVK